MVPTTLYLLLGTRDTMMQRGGPSAGPQQGRGAPVAVSFVKEVEVGKRKKPFENDSMPGLYNVRVVTVSGR